MFAQFQPTDTQASGVKREEEAERSVRVGMRRSPGKLRGLHRRTHTDARR